MMLNASVLLIFVVSLFLATLWFIRTVRKIATGLYTLFLPSSRDDPARRDKPLPRLSVELVVMPMPWGWAPTGPVVDTPVVQTIDEKPVPVPWGWPGHKLKPAHTDRRSGRNQQLELPFLLPGISETPHFGGYSESRPARQAKPSRIGRPVVFSSRALRARLPWGW